MRRGNILPPSRRGEAAAAQNTLTENSNGETCATTPNHSADPFSLKRTGSFGRRSGGHKTDATISEADDEQEEEESDHIGSPLRGFSSSRRQTTKRLSRSTSQRRRTPAPEKMNLKEEIRENVVLSK